MQLRVKGNDLPNGLWTTTLTLGPGISKAVRIYSEPSHTLMALVVDSNAMPVPSETDWWKRNIGGPVPAQTGFMRAPLAPGKNLQLMSHGRPADDNHFNIYVYGVWPDGEERDDDFGHFYTDRTFNFMLTKSSA